MFFVIYVLRGWSAFDWKAFLLWYSFWQILSQIIGCTSLSLGNTGSDTDWYIRNPISRFILLLVEQLTSWLLDGYFCLNIFLKPVFIYHFKPFVLQCSHLFRQVHWWFLEKVGEFQTHVITARNEVGARLYFSQACVILFGGGCLVPGGVPGGDPPGTATAAGGTYPTGMHSCFITFSDV